ncbi:penicillin amidase [Duganella sp. Leaf61]|uniref:penicillin acylase family protein n=1 Tax=Duganella sp. Leaf61 TaxID=1736227 RepID=UPI0006FB3428|nr:penicillin acylase family protein [Duganella sp. Leaf61]KQN70700.1 penicillin amidase [Duganella sp. Leaf61]
MRNKRWWKWPGRVLLAVVCLMLLAVAGGWLYLRASLPALDGMRTATGLHDTVSVARDQHGVPVISGESRLDVAYATGFVHAQERYFQMDLLRRVAAGELSELFGLRALPTDQAHRLHRLRARADLALAALPAGDQQLLARYTDGVNAGLGALGARPFEYVLTGAAPRPWRAADSLLVIWAMYFDLQGNQLPRELARGWLRDHTDDAQRAFLAPSFTPWDAPLDAATVSGDEAPIPATAPAWWGRPRTPGLQASRRLALAAPSAVSATAPRAEPSIALVPTLAESSTASLVPFAQPSTAWLNTVGSNNWAVAGSRSDSGAAIVANDMHLGLQLPVIWYRAALQFADGKGGQRRVVGVTLPGAPVVVVGSNGQVAWGFTNSYGDYLDLVEVDADPAHPGQVRTPAGLETPVVHHETIIVKGQASQTLTVRDTSLGPLREADGKTYAVRWTAHQPGAVNVRAHLLESVATVEQALALAPTLGIPAQNMVAGDSGGHIGWTIAGRIPRRAINAMDASYPLHGDDPAAAWQGWLAADAYPKLIDPAGGQLFTANSRQLNGAGAALLGDGGYDLGARSRQVRDGLTALGPRTGVRQVYAVALDDRALFLAPWRDRAIAALDARAVAGQPLRAEALALLRSTWTGRASVDSVAYRLTRGYMYALYDILYGGADQQLPALDPKAGMAAVSARWPVVVARLLDAQPPAWLPPGHASWQAVQLAALDRVIADLTQDGRRLADATWGQRNTAASAHPMAASIPVLGRYLKVAPDMMAGDQHMPRVAGPTFGASERLTVAPGREDEGLFNMPGGQSGHPLSPYFLDGRDDWVAGRATPLLPGPPVHTLHFSRP